MTHVHSEKQKQTAKLFSNGASQAVRLPAEFRFEGSEVFIRRDERSGEVILSSTERKGWAEFAALRDQLHAALVAEGEADYRPERDRPLVAGRDSFEGWQE